MSPVPRVVEVLGGRGDGLEPEMVLGVGIVLGGSREANGDENWLRFMVDGVWGVKGRQVM